MLKPSVYSVFLFLLYWGNFSGQAQNTNFNVEIDTTIAGSGIDPLSPARAAFYSAVLPGLGQAYNKKYWKIPIVYAAIGTGAYFYIDNKKLLKRYQTAYKQRIAGYPDEFNGKDDNPLVSNEGLIRAQDVLTKNRDLALFITIGLYALNIIEANVDAHLDDRVFNQKLSFRPAIYMNPIDNKLVTGISLCINF
jgi:hypothetical protein